MLFIFRRSHYFTDTGLRTFKMTYEDNPESCPPVSHVPAVSDDYGIWDAEDDIMF